MRIERSSRKTWLLVGMLLIAAQVAYAAWRAAVGHSDLLCYHNISLHWWRTGQYTQVYGVRHYVPGFVILMAPPVAGPPGSCRPTACAPHRPSPASPRLPRKIA